MVFKRSFVLLVATATTPFFVFVSIFLNRIVATIRIFTVS